MRQVKITHFFKRLKPAKRHLVQLKITDFFDEFTDIDTADDYYVATNGRYSQMTWIEVFKLKNWQ